jgi:hypothetical protein
MEKEKSKDKRGVSSLYESWANENPLFDPVIFDFHNTTPGNDWLFYSDEKTLNGSRRIASPEIIVEPVTQETNNGIAAFGNETNSSEITEKKQRKLLCHEVLPMTPHEIALNFTSQEAAQTPQRLSGAQELRTQNDVNEAMPGTIKKQVTKKFPRLISQSVHCDVAECKETFKNKTALYAHMRKNHCDTAQYRLLFPFSCQDCGKRLAQLNGLTTHRNKYCPKKR